MAERGTPWPPQDMAVTLSKMAEWSAWYSGDPERLIEFYAQAPSGGRIQFWRFWSRIAREPIRRAGSRAQDSQKAQLHVPIAGDLAAVSGALLFGEEPQIRIKEMEQAGAGTAEKDAETRLQEIILGGGAYNRLVEAAESASAMGGAYIYPAWDETVADFPVANVVQADQALPDFVFGMLRAVTFWEELHREKGLVIRHLEYHDRDNASAYIRNSVFRGDENYLGAPEIVENWQLLPEIRLPFPELDVQYIPNMRPNRLWRNSQLGLSDYSGSEGMFDSLDEVYASWMRDIRLAKARIIVPRDFIDDQGAMDVDWEVYQPMDIDPSSESGARSMVAQQFQIRHAEHLATALELVERIVSNSGYSPQTFGLRIEGRAESGTALRIRESKTVLTLKRKANWWKPALETLFRHMLLIDSWKFDHPAVEGLHVEVVMNDGIPDDPIELANTANTLKAAEAASIETRVRIVNPQRDREWIDAEVKRIQDEKKSTAAAASATGFGNPGGQVPPPTDQPEDGGIAIQTDPATGVTTVARKAAGGGPPA